MCGCVSVCTPVYLRVCVRVCVCEWASERVFVYASVCIYCLGSLKNHSSYSMRKHLCTIVCGSWILGSVYGSSSYEQHSLWLTKQWPSVCSHQSWMPRLLTSGTLFFCNFSVTKLSFSLSSLQFTWIWQKPPYFQRWLTPSLAWYLAATQLCCWLAWAQVLWQQATWWVSLALWLLRRERSCILPGQLTKSLGQWTISKMNNVVYTGHEVCVYVFVCQSIKSKVGMKY